MKKNIFVLLLVLVAGSFAWVSAEEEKTLEGTLVDTKCYIGSKGMLKGNDHMGVKDCGTMCAKQGIPVALLHGEKIHVLFNPSTKLADHIGQNARVTGRIDPGTNGIIASKVEVQKDGKWHKVDLGAEMM